MTNTDTAHEFHIIGDNDVPQQTFDSEAEAFRYARKYAHQIGAYYIVRDDGHVIESGEGVLDGQ